MVEGLQRCIARRLSHVEVETDSELAFKMITRKTTDAWRYSRTIRNIRNLHMPHAKVQFTVRVSNKVADALAKLAYAMDDTIMIHTMVDLPTLIRKIITFIE